MRPVLDARAPKKSRASKEQRDSNREQADPNSNAVAKHGAVRFDLRGRKITGNVR